MEMSLQIIIKLRYPLRSIGECSERNRRKQFIECYLCAEYMCYMVHDKKYTKILFVTCMQTNYLLSYTTQAMEAVVDKGLSRSIGVSNHSIAQLRKTIAAARIPPAVCQVNDFHYKPLN